MLENVLNGLLPAVPSHSSTKSPGSPANPLSTVRSEELNMEVLEFLGILVRRFGNLTRAFRAIKRAAGRGRKDSSLLPISKAEFTWCVTSFLYYGDHSMACKLFAAISGGEGMALCDLTGHMPEGLLSLQQVRQQLLQEWSMEEVKEILQSQQEDQVSKQDFMKIVTDLGMDFCQAWHFFELLEDGGLVQMADLHEALLSNQTRLLWPDLWKQLVVRFGSIADAFRTLETCVESPLAQKTQRDELFAKWMQSWSICREDALEFFNSLLGQSCGDTDGSDGSLLLKLKHSLRSAAPQTSLDDFWHRVAAEWPEVLEAARTVKSSPQRLADLLSELLPEEMRFPSAQSGVQSVPSRQSESSPFSLLSLDLEAFTALAMHIDVSQENAADLFYSVIRSASGGQSSHENVPEAQVFLDDFAEQLILWTEGVDRRRPLKDKIQHFRFAPVRAVISALKAELLPSQCDQPVEEPKPKVMKLPKLKDKKKRPQLPWCTYYHLRPTPVPTALT